MINLQTQSPSTSPSPSPSPRSPLPLPLPPRHHAKKSPMSLNQIVISKQPRTPVFHRLTKQPSAMIETPGRTNPLVWLGAIACLVFSLVVIFLGIATLALYLAVRPRIPSFDAPDARLSTVYFDSAEHFNGEFAFLANFTNPNRRLRVRFERASVGLYFSDRLISAAVLQPFSQGPRETRLEPIHLTSSLVFLPRSHAVALRTQVLTNRVSYDVRANFRVRASLGALHVSYWLHSRCQLQMTGPPFGVLVARNCVTKR